MSSLFSNDDFTKLPFYAKQANQQEGTPSWFCKLRLIPKVMMREVQDAQCGILWRASLTLIKKDFNQIYLQQFDML